MPDFQQSKVNTKENEIENILQHSLDLTGLNKKIACLTLDVECDYGDLLDTPQYEGITNIPNFVDYFEKTSIPLTAFIQGSLMTTHPEYIKLLTKIDVECQVHSYSQPKAMSKFPLKFQNIQLTTKVFKGCLRERCI